MMFSDVSPDDLQAWRSLPITEALASDLDTQLARVADAVIAAIRLDRTTEAKILMGHLDAIQHLIITISARPAVLPQLADNFIDPAAIWSTK